MISSVAALSIFIQGLSLGLNTGDKLLKQFVEWVQSSDFQTTVISPFAYSFVKLFLTMTINLKILFDEEKCLSTYV